MFPGQSLDQILQTSARYPGAHDFQILSIVFAEPGDDVVGQLRVNKIEWDEATGGQWQVFFAGFSYHPDQPILSTKVLDGPSDEDHWYFMLGPRDYLARDVSVAHHAALTAAGRPDRPWAFDGRPQVLSVIRYPIRDHKGSPTRRSSPDWRGNHDGEVDWLSLKAVHLAQGGRTDPLAVGFSEILHGLRGDPDGWDERFAPGGSPYGDLDLSETISGALLLTGRVAAAGVLGNAADRLVRGLLSRSEDV